MAMARKRDSKRAEGGGVRNLGLIVDPRLGDIEDDASSTKRRSMLSLAGSLLAEISLPKLLVAWSLLLVVPGFLLGLAPIIFIEWFKVVTDKLTSLVIGLWCVAVLAALVALGWFGWRTLFRMAEENFWALNSIVVQPGYAAFREALRQFSERLFARKASEARRARLRAATAAVAGILICSLAMLVLYCVWPRAHLFGRISEIDSWGEVAIAALANSLVVISAYLAVAALIWSFADAAMEPPRSFGSFDKSQSKADRTWRIAHLSDLHVVGERYGFRIESGRLGPRGNERLKLLLEQLEALHAKDPFDAILLTGDMTDAGISSEWAEFLCAFTNHPSLACRVLMLPGNHDLNIVDRANPARFDLPTSSSRPLRRLRVLSAMNAVQGDRVRVVDREKGCIGETLENALKPYRADLKRFADIARPVLSKIPEIWARAFPMIDPPTEPNGLGVILLNSNADTHFSFTNALGMVSAEQMRGIHIARAEYPDACWIIALHHHVVEYPWAAKALSERIGTALINGNWFVRSLQPIAGRAILMHGHRHVDWIGHCAGLSIVSAPSPVMEVTDEKNTAFYIHTLAIHTDCKLRLLSPERIVVAGKPTRSGP